jgi:hypothetical protein
MSFGIGFFIQYEINNLTVGSIHLPQISLNVDGRGGVR